MAELLVRAMTESEYDEWRATVIRAFAEEQVANGSWAPAEAEVRARRGNDDLLPDGFATAGMVFLTALHPDLTPVGVLWMGLRHPRGTPDCGFVYDLEVAEAFRGRGYGRRLLEVAEETARSAGVGALELNVFGDNSRAIGLYESTGYRVVTQQMRKTFGLK